MSKGIVSMLELSGDDIRLGDSCFREQYSLCVNRFMQGNKLYLKFKENMSGELMNTAAIYIAWLALLDLVAERDITATIKSNKDEIYDSLALKFFEIREELSPKMTTKTEDTVRKWTSVIVAAVIMLLNGYFDCSKLLRNVAFYIKLERYVSVLVLGFASSEMDAFHQTVYHCLDDATKAVVPTDIVSTALSARSPKIGASTRDLMLALTLSKMNDDVRRSESRYLFEHQQQTPLLTRALELHGVYKVPGHKPSYAKKDALMEDTDERIKLSSSITRCRNLQRQYALMKRETIKALCQNQTSHALKINRTLHNGEQVANSPTGTVIMYQKLENNMHKRRKDFEPDSSGKPKRNQQITKFTNMDPAVALAIAEDEYLS